jgi:predicted site-specific integrase-resolvase
VLTTEEARQHMEEAGVRVTVQTIRRWFREGRLTGTQVGPESPIMIDEESINRVIREARRPKET